MITLQRGVNSFADQEELDQAIEESVAFNELIAGDEEGSSSALYNAYENLSQMTVDIVLVSSETIIVDLADLTSTLLDELETDQPKVYRKLIRAQMIEADFLLGGNPTEDRRRAGMMSDSSGESAQFFRTSKPLVLPICREAALVLRGIIKYGSKVGRV